MNIEEHEINEFEFNGIEKKLREKMETNFAFSKNEKITWSYHFADLIVTTESDDIYHFYPVVKIINNKQIIVEYEYRSESNELTVDEFNEKISILMLLDFKKVRLENSYFKMFELDHESEKIHLLNNENDDYFKTLKSSHNNLHDINSLLVQHLIDTDSYYNAD